MQNPQSSFFWRRVLNWTWIVALGALLINMTVLIRTRARAQSVSTPAYTVVLRETVFDKTGASHQGLAITRAVRSDGSEVARLGDADQGSRLLEFSSGERVVTNAKTALKSTFLARPFDGTRYRDPRNHCLTAINGASPGGPALVLLGEETIAGFRVAKIQRGNLTEWLAVEYGCAPVKKRFDWGKDGSSESTLVTLVPGDPDPSLFMLTGLKEAPPSALDEPTPNCTGTCLSQKLAHLAKLDDEYRSHRPNQ